MADLQVTGVLKKVFETQTLGEKGFTKRDFVIETQEKFPQSIVFQLIKENTDVIDAYGVGQEIAVHFNLKGNEYKDKFYVNLTAWKIQPVLKVNEPKSQNTTDPVMQPLPFDMNSEQSQDLPF